MENVNAFTDIAAPLISQLAYRWQDEKQYENFDDYMLPFKKIAKAHGITLVKMTKRPFALYFTTNGMKFKLVVKRDTVVCYDIVEAQ